MSRLTICLKAGSVTSALIKCALALATATGSVGVNFGTDPEPDFDAPASPLGVESKPGIPASETTFPPKEESPTT